MIKTHPTRFWEYRPGWVRRHRGVTYNINAHGLRGPLVPFEKEPGERRILFLGDSCTQQGYPAEVATLLTETGGGEGPDFDSVTLAVAGYSSFQGRVIAERLAGGLEGDLALVYFGWNDHWLANGAPDVGGRRTDDAVDGLRRRQVPLHRGQRPRAADHHEHVALFDWHRQVAGRHRLDDYPGGRRQREGRSSTRSRSARR